MADMTPGGAVVSFADVIIADLAGVAGIGYPTVPSTPVEAYESVLGQPLPVDMLNTASAPRKTTFTCTILVRAPDNVPDPSLAWTAVLTGYRALASMPEAGILVVQNDAAGNGTVACQARRKALNLTIAPQNARSLLIPLEFTLLTMWV